jgi:hypothetical protein
VTDSLPLNIQSPMRWTLCQHGGRPTALVLRMTTTTRRLTAVPTTRRRQRFHHNRSINDTAMKTLTRGEYDDKSCRNADVSAVELVKTQRFRVQRCATLTLPDAVTPRQHLQRIYYNRSVYRRCDTLFFVHQQIRRPSRSRANAPVTLVCLWD